MSTYAIGDVQGCFSQLNNLLEKINFDIDNDTLWFTGDLVNRGPHSLEVLRFVKNLGEKQHTVLGNHDLHLLALAENKHQGKFDETLFPILNAPDKNELLDWLTHLPLIYHDESLGFTLIHAGLSPSWDLHTAQQLSKEVEHVLQSNARIHLLEKMYGNHPDRWDDSLTGIDRLRCIINFFTRLRFCHPDGRMEFSTKGKIEDTQDLLPWFKLPNRRNQHLKIIFGHWAALLGVTDTPHVYAVDTGCVWGNTLTAMRLEDGKLFHVSCA